MAQEMAIRRIKMKHKLIKVTFEFTDTIETLEDRPQEWMDEIHSYIGLQALRTSSKGMSEYKWKREKK